MRSSTGWVLLAALAAAPALALAQGSASVHAIDTDPSGEPSYHYDPRELTVAPGATVTFVGGNVEPHTLTNDAPQGSRAFDTGAVQPGQSATLTAPTTPGDYPFHCLFHGGMTGTLHVQLASTTTPATSTTAAKPSGPTPGVFVALGVVFGVVALAALMLRRRRR